MAVKLSNALKNSIKSKREKNVEDTKKDKVKDPKEYKLLNMGANEMKVLYIPNLTRIVPAFDEEGQPVVDTNGNPVMKEEMAIADYDIHATHRLVMKDGNMRRLFAGSYRCTKYLKDPDQDLDGSCPLCNAKWEVEKKWVDAKAEAEARKRGISPDTQKDEMKGIRREFWQKTLISDTKTKYIVPVFEIKREQVIIDGRKGSRVAYAKDENGNPIMLDAEHKMPDFEAYFLVLTSDGYKKLTTCLIGEDEYETPLPAGHEIKVIMGASKNERDAMGPVRDRNFLDRGPLKENLAYIGAYLDKLAEEKYNEDIAIEQVIEANILTNSELRNLANERIGEHVKELAILEAEALAHNTNTSELDELMGDVEAE